MRHIIEIEMSHHQVAVMSHRAFPNVVQHVWDSAGSKNDWVGDQEHQGACAQQEHEVPPAKRWIFLSVQGQEVIEEN